MRLEAYRELVSGGLSDDELNAIRVAVNSGLAVGSKRFKGEIELRHQRRVTALKAGRPRKNT